MRDLLRHLHHQGYLADRRVSRELRLFGGLLCCPWNQNTLVLKKHRPLRTCHARLLEQLPESQPCVLQQNYGCIPGGIWVHFGCRGRFSIPNCRDKSNTICESMNEDYVECFACEKSRLKEALPAVPRAVALVGRTQRSDFLLTQPEAVSMNSSYFAQLFGLPIPWLYDAMDPLTSAPGLWEDRRSMVLLLRAVKLAVLGQLGRAAVLWQEWRSFASVLRGCAHPLVKRLLEVLSPSVDAQNGSRGPTLTGRPAKFHGDVFQWQGISVENCGRLRFTQATPWARYIYRFAYHVSATLWTP